MGNADFGYPSANSYEGGGGGHRVAVPPPQPFIKSLKNTMKETLFPDDPLRQFKNQPPKKKFILGLQYIFPIFEWGPRYTIDFFKSDLIAGITIASLAIPQGISYAKLANLPPILGLCKIYYSSPFKISISFNNIMYYIYFKFTPFIFYYFSNISFFHFFRYRSYIFFF